MEWVETTGRTVDEAKKSALEQLGVAESEAEFEVISEPKIGLFGRLKEEARVRARIQPRYPRPKGDRRDRRRSRPHAAHEGATGAASDSETGLSSSETVKSAEVPEGGSTDDTTGRPERVAAGARRRRPRAARPVGDSTARESGSFDQVNTASIEEQVQMAEAFLQGLLAQLGATATITSNELTDDLVEVRIDGDGLGTLIGPKGATLLALQELTRTVLQRQSAPSDSRIVVDVNGYRRRRQEALARFAQQVAQEVKASNTKRALEPMPPSDRKVVHDAIGTIAGVGTLSEGEEPYRRVVVVPVAADAASGAVDDPEDGDTAS